MIRAHSTAQGMVRFTLPYDGAWMISAVHMIPATDSAEVDWDSFWGNLTFELPMKITAAKKSGGNMVCTAQPTTESSSVQK